MRLSRTVRIVITAPVLSFALVAAPAMASERVTPATPSAAPPRPLMQLSMVPEVRNSWLNECRERAGYQMRKKRAASYCSNYLTDYEARYTAHYAYYSQPGVAYGYQPAPIQRTEPVCKETIEYE